MSTNAYFLFFIFTIQIKSIFLSQVEKSWGCKMVRGDTIVEPSPPGRKHQILGKEIFPQHNVPILITFYCFFSFSISMLHCTVIICLSISTFLFLPQALLNSRNLYLLISGSPEAGTQYILNNCLLNDRMNKQMFFSNSQKIQQ